MKGAEGQERAGFTLVELLIVIAIIIVLAAAIFAALNPAQRFQDARNSRRLTDVSNIATALKADYVDNGGGYAAAIAGPLGTGSAYMIGTDTTGCDVSCGMVPTSETCLDLAPLVSDGYLNAVPKDPIRGTDGKTHYYMKQNGDDTVTVGVCSPEGSAEINVTR